MKKLILLFTVIFSGTLARAQSMNIVMGKAMIRDKNYMRAIQYLDYAVEDGKTKDSADAWYWRGKAYLMMQLDSTLKTKHDLAIEKATKSFVKALELQPDYSTDINIPMHTTAILSYNQGVANFQNKIYTSAYDDFLRVVTLYNAGGGKRFLSNKDFTAIIPDAKTNAAYAAQALIEEYQKENKTESMFAMIKEARKQFPDSKTFRDLELNYYINSGKQAELLPLLEAAVKEEPDNPELFFNLANVYMYMAFPVDENGKRLPAPANFKELYLKTETAYKKALSLKPDDADYNYNAGVLYYSNSELNKAQPYLEKSYTLLSAKAASSLSDPEKATYRNTLIGLKEIYSHTNKAAKADEMKKKLDELK